MTSSAPDHRPTVAVLGTGTLGAPIARHLTGVASVRVWNRTTDRAAPLSEHGCTVSHSAAEAVADADAVLTVLADNSSLQAVMTDEVLDATTEGTVWVQSSTIGVSETQAWAVRAAKAGVSLVDAPLLGTRGPAERGQLVVLASGADAALEQVTPLLDSYAKTIVRVGEAGAGTRLKLAVNSWLLSLVQVLAESIAFTRAMGFEPETLFDTLDAGGVSLPYVRLKGGAMAAEHFPPDFTLTLARKDLALVLDAAADTVSMTAATTALAGFDRAIALGHGGDDYAATYLAVRAEQ
ncbi:NAD(P)-dependent oxidoreductase [Mangrovihabitans endophyticus]|uniref:3-hydroxyisobutyrate dehydrogenase n=1 Tax=Mangrovihabitans endophyticus TaxID=1751298 RepID=A0A8J3BW38_9ACTN|nr:NAD(P)-dependent oxidoreductase [Mangrovihabitans endophyticus]GGK82117.1 3-hydroxyisobutyrate dehydrogenase [Mangrovihabitans endophyticus]